MAGVAERPRAPKLRPDLGWVWRCWHTLHAERPESLSGFAAPMGGLVIKPVPRRLPWSLLRDWCAAEGRGRADLALLQRLVAEMDDVFLDWWNRSQAKP